MAFSLKGKKFSANGPDYKAPLSQSICYPSSMALTQLLSRLSPSNFRVWMLKAQVPGSCLGEGLWHQTFLFLVSHTIEFK